MLVNTLEKDILSRVQTLILALNKLSFIWGDDEIQISISVSLKSFNMNSKLADLYGDNNLFGDRIER